MKVEVKKRANNSFTKLLHWIETQNTTHAAQKWSDEFYDYLEHLASIKVNYTICKDPKLAKYQYRCFTYKDKWIVAYKVIGDKFIVYRFLYGPWLTYVPTTI
jgi:hypothetical protein